MTPVTKKPRREESTTSDSNVKPDGVIKWEIDNFSEMNQRISPTKEICGVSWNLGATKTASKTGDSSSNLKVSILVNHGSASPLWKCEFKYGMFLRKRGVDNKPRRFFSRSVMCNDNSTTGVRFFSAWESLLDPNKGIIDDDKVIVEVWIYVKSFTGMPCMPRFDFSAPCDTRSDVVLIIEGKQVHVSRQYLALYSEFFHTLFFGDFAEKGKKEIELKDISYEEFVEMLHVIYPSFKKITDDSFEYLLKLGDRFQVPCVMERVEDFIIEDSKISKYMKRKFATLYRLSRLHKMVFSKLPELNSSHQDLSSDKDIDFSDSGDSRSDVALSVEGKKLHVNKQFLGIYSPVLHNLFFDNVIDREEKEFKLDDVNYEEFIALLHVLYSPLTKITKITDASAEYVLKLADRFQIACVIERAEYFIIDSENISIPEKLRIAEKFKLFRLQDHCFSELITPSDFKAVKDSPAYKTLSDATKIALFEHMVNEMN